MAIKYSGKKTKIIHFINHFDKNCTVLDLYAGSQTIGILLKRTNKIICNDIQKYSYVLGKAYIENNTYSMLPILSKPYNHTPKLDLFRSYYSDIFFTKEQCIEIDSIRETIESVKEKDEILYYCYLSCLLQTLLTIARITGHFSGNLKTTHRTSIKVSKLSAWRDFINKINYFRVVLSNHDNECYNMEGKELLKYLSRNDRKVDIIYLDPPYTKASYSLKYHVLESCITLDRNINFSNKIRTPVHVFKSNFCLKTKVEQEFKDVLELSYAVANKKIIISYNEIGLMDHELLLNLCKQYDSKTVLYKKPIKYAQQYMTKGIRANELLYIININGGEKS